MTIVLPPSGADGPGFNPWDDRNRDNVEFLPVAIKTPSGDFSFDLPTYYAGFFDIFDFDIPFSEMKEELRERLDSAHEHDESIFNQADDSDGELNIEFSDPTGNQFTFFVLENFSNPELELSEIDREKIREELRITLFINEFGGPAKDINKANAYFVFLCKLLATQEMAEQISLENPLIDEHKELLDIVISNFVGSMEYAQSMSEIRVLPRKHFESLIKSDMPSGIKKKLWEIVQLTNWQGRVAQFGRNLSEAKKESLTSEAIVKDAKLAQQTFEKLTKLEGILKPNTGNKRKYWEYPLASLLSAIKEKKTLVYIPEGPFKGFKNDVDSAPSPNTLKVQLRFLRESAEMGFNNWLLSGPFIGLLDSVCTNLLNTQEEISLYDFKQSISKFLDPNQNKSDEDIRDLLFLDKSKKRSNTFRHGINFINEVRKITKEFNIRTSIFQTAFDEREVVDNWLDDENSKRLSFGENIGILMEDSIFIVHTAIYEKSSDDGFSIMGGIPYKVKSLASLDGYGWGKDKSKSVCIPIEGNTELLELKTLEDLNGGDAYSTQIAPDFEKNFDFMIVTNEGKDSNGDDEVKAYDPSPKVKSSGPLVLT